MKEKVKLLIEEIENAQEIMIFRHIRPDLDAIGSQMAFKQFLEDNYPNKKVYALGSEEEKEFRELGQQDTISSEKARKALAIVLDTANEERIQNQKYKLATKVIKIDHHPNDTPYGDIEIIDDKSSSTAELIYEIFQAFPKEKFSVNFAFLIFCGIYGDTGGFKFPNTTAKTFRVVSQLVELGFEYENTIQLLTSHSENIVRIVGYAYQNAVIVNDIAYIKLDESIHQKLNIKANEASIISNFLGIFRNIKAWVVFNQYPQFIRVNIRSKGKVDVRKIANQFSGGGHKNASGAKINDWSESDIIINKLIELVKESD